jgi:peptide/nickel transport system substrate-binding protein
MTASRTQVTTLALIAACAAGCLRDRRTPDDTLVVLVGERVNSLDPRYTETSLDVTLSRLVAPGLTTIETPSLEPHLLMAESIDRPDELTVDVVLRPGLRFSDGTPVTADDVVFTYQSMLDPAMKSPLLRPMRDRFTKIEARGERAVRFHLVAPVATIMTDFEFGIVSARAAGASRRFRDGRVVGAGPVRVESFDPEEVRLRRSPTWQGDLHSEWVRIQVVRDSNARSLMLVGGSADLTQNGIRIDLVDDLAESPRVAVSSAPSSKLTYLMLNNRDPVLRDVRVRRAIAYAIDRERVMRAKLDGLGVLATGLLPPGHWAYNGEVASYHHDPARAMALLDEAGFRDPDGPGGRPRLRLTYKTSADQFRVALARVWAAQLGEVGIQVDVQSFEFATVLADYKRGNFQIGSLQTATISEPDFLYAYFSSTRIPTTKEPGGLNRWGYSSPLVDELTEKGRRTLDRERRRAIYADVQAILARDVPIVPLWHEHNVAVMNIDLRGFELYRSANLWGVVAASKER